MEYKCKKCNYVTLRKIDLDRHYRRKNPCQLRNDIKFSINESKPAKVDLCEKNPAKVDLEKTFDPAKVDLCEKNPAKVDLCEKTPAKVDLAKEKCDEKSQPNNDLICCKCERVFTRLDNKKKHEKKCNGLKNQLQCQNCLKHFSSKYGKYKHIRYVKCKRANTTIIHQHIGVMNNYVTNITNHTTIRLCFGNEILHNLCNEDDYMQKMDEYIKLLKYALPHALEDVYFNDKYPENQTIKKERKNDNLVSIHIGDEQWVKRHPKDMIKYTIDKLHNYMEKYISEVELTPLKRRQLRLFGNEMQKLSNWTTDTIEDKLQMESFKNPSDKEMIKQEKEVTKLLVDKMYEKSKNR
jgi:hypothetical protein